MIDIIQTALELNNSVTLTKIPYHYLTRIETTPLIALNKLSIKIQMTNYIQPYIENNTESLLKLKYQIMCKDHMKDLLENFDTIYVSMAHLADAIKVQEKDFYYSDMYKQFHLVFQLLDWDDDELHVKIMPLDYSNFLKHQEIARSFECNFNLKHNVKRYISCPSCFPTIAGTGLYYKEMNGKLPNKLATIEPQFMNAFVLIKSDRIPVETICRTALTKWKVNNCQEYEKKMTQLAENNRWHFDLIISALHKTHYTILKGCERIRDKESENGAWKRNTSSPSWRSGASPAISGTSPVMSNSPSWRK